MLNDGRGAIESGFCSTAAAALAACDCDVPKPPAWLPESGRRRSSIPTVPTQRSMLSDG
jgi:hypothetical protein